MLLVDDISDSRKLLDLSLIMSLNCCDWIIVPSLIDRNYELFFFDRVISFGPTRFSLGGNHLLVSPLLFYRCSLHRGKHVLDLL